MSSPAFYKELADAIYHGDTMMLSAADSRSFDEKVTLTEAVVVNGGTRLPANTTLRIQRPASVRTLAGLFFTSCHSSIFSPFQVSDAVFDFYLQFPRTHS